MPKYLCFFFQTYQTFRLRELEAVASMFNIPISYDTSLVERIESDDVIESLPYLYIDIPSDEDVKKICSRAVLVRGFYKIWADATNYDDLLKQLQTNYDQEYLENFHKDKHWKIGFETLGKKVPRLEQLERMHRLKPSPLFLGGRVAMEPTPGIEHYTWAVIENYGLQRDYTPPEPHNILFGIFVCNGNREVIIKFNLQDRAYLGTTSMDPELSVISINMGHVKPGTLMLDPFVGTGSFVLVSSYFGAHTIGCDIDITAMKKTKGCNIDTNFEQLGLTDKYLGSVLCDNSIPTWRATPMFDSIVCDPPYGIRAGAKRIGPDKNRRLKRPPEGFRWNYMPQHCEYKVPDVMADLLELAAKNLVMNGRLVYWLPTTPDFKESDLPKHPCLELVSNCLQILTMKWGRRLITMKKVLEFDPIKYDKSLLTKFDLGQIDAAHEDLRTAVYSPSPITKATNEKSKKELKKERKRECSRRFKQQQNDLNNQEQNNNNNNDDDGDDKNLNS